MNKTVNFACALFASIPLSHIRSLNPMIIKKTMAALLLFLSQQLDPEECHSIVILILIILILLIIKMMIMIMMILLLIIINIAWSDMPFGRLPFTFSFSIYVSIFLGCPIEMVGNIYIYTHTAYYMHMGMCVFISVTKSDILRPEITCRCLYMFF